MDIIVVEDLGVNIVCGITRLKAALPPTHIVNIKTTLVPINDFITSTTDNRAHIRKRVELNNKISSFIANCP